jgi:hypothetical protein
MSRLMAEVSYLLHGQMARTSAPERVAEVVLARRTSILVGDDLDSESCGCHHAVTRHHHGLVCAAAIGVTGLLTLAVAVVTNGGSS